jgi:hypothetical protein
MPSTASSSASSPMPVPPAPGLPSRAADLEGEIIQNPRKDAIPQPLEWPDYVLRTIFFPFVLPSLLRDLFSTSPHPKPTTSVYTVRVEDTRTGIPKIREARLEGDHMGGGLSLSDQVSLWGIDKGGTLMVSQGYNHTTSARFPLRRPVQKQVKGIAAITLPILLVSALILFAPLIPALLSAIVGLIIFGIVMYIVLLMLLPGMLKRAAPYIVGALMLLGALGMCAQVLGHIH